jgi:hypothetical protein
VCGVSDNFVIGHIRGGWLERRLDSETFGVVKCGGAWKGVGVSLKVQVQRLKPNYKPKP